MPAITVSSVNTTTNEITAVAHGLTTGDRFRLRNVGGALPASTPALAGATDLFAVRTGADTLKISDTNAHALAGTGIFDLTGSGSGTTTVEYGLPYCVPRILANGSQVFSADLNADWNSLVALYDLLTGQAQSVWGSVSLAVGITGGIVVSGGVVAANGGITVPSGQAVALNGTTTLTTGTGAVTLGGTLALSGTTSPTAITATTTINDWAPTGLSTASVIRQVVTNAGSGANVPVTGLTGGIDGRILILYALGTQAADTITLMHENAGSTASNRFSLASGSNLVIPQFGCVTLRYDGTGSRWRANAKNF